MPRLLIFATSTPGDEALWNSHWMAQQTARLPGIDTTMVEGDAAVREVLEAALGEAEVTGVALFGHGLPHAVLGADGREALDVGNAACVGPRWAHLMACHTGRELIPGCASHPGLFVGYEVPLVVEWSVEDLPEDLRGTLARLVTATTLALLAGRTAKADLQGRVSAEADALTAWVVDHPEAGASLGLCVFAQQLVERMVLSRASAV